MAKAKRKTDRHETVGHRFRRVNLRNVSCSSEGILDDIAKIVAELDKKPIVDEIERDENSL